MTNGNDKERGTGLLDELQAGRPSEGPPQMQQANVMAPKTHDEIVERRLLAIAWFTGIVAAAVVANFVATVGDCSCGGVREPLLAGDMAQRGH